MLYCLLVAVFVIYVNFYILFSFLFLRDISIAFDLFKLNFSLFCAHS